MVFLFKLGVAFLDLPDLFGGKDLVVINLNRGVLLEPAGKSSLRDTVFFAEGSLRLVSILIEVDDSSFGFFVIPGVMFISGHVRYRLCVSDLL